MATFEIYSKKRLERLTPLMNGLTKNLLQNACANIFYNFYIFILVAQSCLRLFPYPYFEYLYFA